METMDISLVDWSRWQFALTACYHWLFVPLTLGLGLIIAIMETKYVRSGDLFWKKNTQFWMRLFGVNFAIGVATGLILEFEFGTNWSNYSWFVGDIFGAPLAIEGIFAFFLEATFMAVMFFGWNKVSKHFHLFSTWMVALGANLSALWILVANAWMQNPVGMQFNPDMARNEMVNFWEVLFSQMAMFKFTHTVASSFMLGAAFVMGVSAWFLLKKREEKMAKSSMKIAVIVGFIATLGTVYTGDGSAYTVSQSQPMKLAAMEALYKGEKGAGLITLGLLNHDKQINDGKNPHLLKLEIPKMHSILAYRDVDAFVPGIEDLLNGSPEYGILSTAEKMRRGSVAIEQLRAYQQAKKDKDEKTLSALLPKFDRSSAEGNAFYQAYFQYFGYGFLKQAEDTVPNVPLVFYSFRLMILVGVFFILIFAYCIYLLFSKQNIQKHRYILYALIVGVPLAYLGSMLGWVVAEVGRQPWVVYGVMRTKDALSPVSAE
ncbi:MAG: cytochrome ubiquinol oxidase subunit I, partial [Bacteroidales bacterium]